MNKIKNIFSKMKCIDWVQFSLWMLTLIMLFEFVIVAALRSNFPNMIKDAEAITGLLFFVSLIGALFITVFAKYFDRKKVNK